MLKKIAVCIGVLVTIVVIILCIKNFPFFAFIYDNATAKDGPMPSDGVWYCKELQIQLCFIPIEYPSDLTLEEYETHTYVMAEEGCVMCGIRIPVRGSIELSVFAQDSEYAEFLGNTFFHGLCMDVTDDCYTIRGDDGIEYQFLKIDDFSAAAYLDSHSNQIDALQQSPYEPKHVELATKYAVDLWKSQFGLTDSIAWDDLCVSYDPESFYWLISLQHTKSVSYFALISENGDFVSIWEE